MAYLPIAIYHRKPLQSWEDFLKESRLPSQEDAEFPYEVFDKADLSNADLGGVNFKGCSLSGANLSGANLRNAKFERADLDGANLSEADLRGADLSGADLDGANLTGAEGIVGSFSETQEFTTELLDRIKGNPDVLNMLFWHSHAHCGTVHCIAGWAYPEVEYPGSIASLTHPELAHLFYETEEQALEGLYLVARGITTVKR